MFSYIEKLSTIDDFKTFKENNEKVVFVFSAPWCPDCVMLDRFFENTVNKFNDIKFVYVNRDDFSEITEALDVIGIPSFVAYKNNKEVSRFVSKFSNTQQNEVLSVPALPKVPLHAFAFVQASSFPSEF